MTSPPFDIWAEFNDIDEHGRTRSLRRFARPGMSLSVGARLVAGDHEGNRCDAEVIGLGEDETVVLALDLGTFRNARDHGSLRPTAD